MWASPDGTFIIEIDRILRQTFVGLLKSERAFVSRGLNLARSNLEQSAVAIALSIVQSQRDALFAQMTQRAEQYGYQRAVLPHYIHCTIPVISRSIRKTRWSAIEREEPPPDNGAGCSASFARPKALDFRIHRRRSRRRRRLFTLKVQTTVSSLLRVK